ncbi:hypothetical protein [Gilvibacter sp.]|uniref:hypothetical protein n=1 Tax=Gilvibacter sp. TaxID=2729997 RepID=UPI0025BF76A1|nr:hypothetical protein [Gilvibacter sp.]NQX78628.1 hypothetical protein [Gilvibacter sp.]
MTIKQISEKVGLKVSRPTLLLAGRYISAMYRNAHGELPKKVRQIEETTRGFEEIEVVDYPRHFSKAIVRMLIYAEITRLLNQHKYKLAVPFFFKEKAKLIIQAGKARKLEEDEINKLILEMATEFYCARLKRKRKFIQRMA